MEDLYYVYSRNGQNVNVWRVGRADAGTISQAFRDWHAGTLTEAAGDLSFTEVEGGVTVNAHVRTIEKVEYVLDRFA